MRQKSKDRFQCTSFLIFFFVLIIGFPIFAYFSGYNHIIEVDKDAYVSEYNPDVNYGSDDYLRAGEYGLGKVYAYYHFNISSHSYDWNEAWIYVKFDYGTNLTDIGANLTGNNWDEMTITWNNKPDSIFYMGHILCDGFDFRIPVNLDQFTDDGISVYLYGKQEGKGEYIQGYSKEGASDNDQIAWIKLSYTGYDPGVFWDILGLIYRVLILIFGIIALIIVASIFAKRANHKYKGNNLPKKVVWNKPIHDVVKLAAKQLGPLPPPNLPDLIPRYYPKSTPTIEKEINQHITLKLEHGKTFIYVNGRRFIQCIRLVLNIQKDDIPLYDEIKSIDEAANVYKNYVYQNRIVQGPMAAPVPNQSHDITPEQEFWGHCSNLQAWVENDYDTRILMSNISFPLLRALSKAGDPVANRVYKEEIALRLEGGYPSVVQYIIAQGYLGEFSPEEFETILASTGLIQKLASESKVFTSFLSTCFRKFPTLSEKIILQILNLPNSEDILLSIIKRDTSSHKSLGGLPYFTQSNTILFLTNLKNVFVSLLQQEIENIREKILNCVHAIESQLSKYDSNSILARRGLYNDRFQLIKNHLINNNALEQFDGEQLKAKALQAKLKLPSRCAFCGKIIPNDKEFCEWCGHKKDDDDRGGFFPYPFIFKPPGGGGSMKAVATVPIKSKA